MRSARKRPAPGACPVRRRRKKGLADLYEFPRFDAEGAPVKRTGARRRCPDALRRGTLFVAW